MPLCSTGLAPPAFTAPCRNQTDDVPPLEATDVPTRPREIAPLSQQSFLISRTTLSQRLQIWRLIDRKALGDVGEARGFSIAIGKDRAARRPTNRESGIVPGDADLALAVINIRTFVFDLSDFAHHAETVREASRHVALFEIFSRQLDADPFAKRRRAAPHIDRHVVNSSLDYAYELRLRPFHLQMQSSDCSSNRQGVIVLHERLMNARGAISVGVKSLEKKTAGVAMDVGNDHDDTRQRGLKELH